MIDSCKCGHWYNKKVTCPDCGTTAMYDVEKRTKQ